MAPHDTFTPGALVGREADLAQLKELVKRTSWVTLLGPPGIGKTRLAREFIRQHDATSYWSDVSQVSTIEAFALALLDTLEVPVRPNQDPRELLVDVCKRHTSEGIWILDGISAVMTTAPFHAFLQTMSESTGLSWIATAMSPVGCSGEYRFRVEPLSFEDAVTLLATRAQPYCPGWTPESQDRDTLALLVKRLDGLPLAIELMTPYLETFEAASLLELLDERFEWLSESGGHTRGLWDALAQAWARASPRDREILERLAVCPGPWSVALLQGALSTSRAGTLRAAQRLCKMSWWHVSPSSEGALPSFAMYETLRDFVLERTDEDRKRSLVQAVGEEVEALAKRWLHEYTHDPDHESLRMLRSHEHVWKWAFERLLEEDPRGYVHCWLALGTTLRDRDASSVLETYSVKVRALLGEVDSDHIRGLYLRGLGQEAMHRSNTSPESIELNALARQHIDPALALHPWAMALRAEFVASLRQGMERHDLLELLEQTARETQDPVVEGLHEITLAQYYGQKGAEHHQDALRRYQRSFQLLQRHAHPLIAMHALWGEALVHGYNKDMSEALSCFERIYAIKERTGSFGARAQLSAYMAQISLYQGELEKCEELTARARAQIHPLMSNINISAYIASIEAQRLIEIGETSQASSLLHSLTGSAFGVSTRMEFYKAMMLLHWVRDEYEEALAAAYKLEDASTEEDGQLWLYMVASCKHLLNALVLWRAQTLDTYPEVPAPPAAFKAQQTWMSRILPWTTLARAWKLYILHGGANEELQSMLERIGGGRHGQISEPLNLHGVLLRILTRHLARLCARAPEARSSRSEQLVISPHCMWLDWRGERIDLQRRSTLRQLLLALANQHSESKGTTLGVYDLFELVWQEEIHTPEAAASRVYNNIARLRALGLADVIKRVDDGYLLDPEVDIVLETEP